MILSYTKLAVGLHVVFVETGDAGHVDTGNEPLSTYWNHLTLLSDYGYSSVTQSTLKFMVRSCANSFVSMRTSAPDGTYEIAIGSYDGTKVSFRYNKSNQGDILVSELLNCYGFRPFWIHWTNESFSLGKGFNTSVDKIHELSWIDSYKVSEVGIMTGFGSTGEWIIYYGDNNTDIRATPLSCSLNENSMGITVNQNPEMTSASSYYEKYTPSNLKLDKKSLSSYRRSKTSAPDSRFSALCMGGVGVAVIVTVVMAVVVIDICSVKIKTSDRK
ncbi:unnamed protein product [Mytilus coruscus]|uniref:Farnesoic acid O-methyl transferase domain-containing protein n=1 Tax=Mytilus coruscus TaxID=42192 RepID=A0A6J8DUG1_MYTCO|nr:unnamed protein product [Mytilus coruscus]